MRLGWKAMGCAFGMVAAASCMSGGGKLSDEECAAMAKNAAKVMGDPDMEANALESCKKADTSDDWQGLRCIARAETPEDIDQCVDKAESSDSAQVRNAKVEIGYLLKAVELYQLQKNGKCPDTVEQMKAAGVIENTKDPWGNDFELHCTTEPAQVSVTSRGPDGVAGTADDVNTSPGS